MALLVYVNDIIITGPSIHAINSLKTFLHSQFKLKDLGGMKYFLGLEIARSSSGIVFSQRHYTLQLLKDTGFLVAKPTTCPMDPKIQLDASTGDVLPDVSIYRHLIGCLLYLTIFRPDITFAVHKLSQFLSQPRVPHLTATHHLLSYLKSNLGQGLFYSFSSTQKLTAFSDADWATCPHTRKFVSSFCIFLGDCLVS